MSKTIKTMFEVNWHYRDDKFKDCTVTRIEVIREGILPDCSAPSITAIDAAGRSFHGSAANYFDTEAEAWASVKRDIEDSVQSLDDRIAQCQVERAKLLEYLVSIRAKD